MGIRESVWAGPDRERSQSSGEVGDGIPRVGRGAEGVGESGEDDFKDDREDDGVLEDFPESGGRVVIAEPEQALDAEDHGEEQWEAEHVVEVIVDEPAAEVVGFEVPAAEGVGREGGDADGVGEVAEAMTGHVNVRSFARLGGMLRRTQQRRRRLSLRPGAIRYAQMWGMALLGRFDRRPD